MELLRHVSFIGASISISSWLLEVEGFAAHLIWSSRRKRGTGRLRLQVVAGESLVAAERDPRRGGVAKASISPALCLAQSRGFVKACDLRAAA